MVSDDHFLTIEIANGWLHGINNWYPDKPPTRGIIYPYSITAFMWLLKQFSLVQPQCESFLFDYPTPSGPYSPYP
jgi:hypothetical protein